MKSKRKWEGSKVTKCQICEGPIGSVFYDFSIPWMGSWAIGCHGCFTKLGGKLGTGAGQKYDSVTLEKLEG